MKTASSSWLKDLVLLSLILSLFFGLFLGQRLLQVPDEGRYSEIPREMIESGDYITPHLNYIKYFEKPPLFYWMQAASIKLFGINLWSLRLATALMGLLGCLFTYVAARKLYNRQTGWFASLILSSSVLYFFSAHIMTLDMTVSVFIAASLLSFIVGVKENNHRSWFWSMYALAGLAVLTKGLIGIVFPCAIIFVWTLLHNEWHSIRKWCIPTGLGIVLFINLPWHILAQIKNPEFFHFYIIEQQFLRYLTNYAHRQQDFRFLPLVTTAGFMPWIVFLAQAIKEQLPTWLNRNQHKEITFLLLSIIIIYIFFQCSHSLLAGYILPIFPFLSIIVAHYLTIIYKRPTSVSFKGGLIALCIFGLLSSLAYLYFIHFMPVQAWTLTINTTLLAITCFSFLLTGLVALLFYYRHFIKKSIMTLFIGSLIFLFSLLLQHSPAEINSIAPLAKIINQHKTSETLVISFGEYYQDLAPYTQKRVLLAGAGLGELTFGAQHQDLKNWVIDEAQFWILWNTNPQPLFMVMDKIKYQHLPPHLQAKLHLLGSTSVSMLFTNQEIQQ
jgi:4-amino-4-deoxy-L-arabinose transferase-like glycosyltransferase